ncbi:hypothetical protein RZN25_09330 [Bacillaceae bacterium S4-13-56]
MDDRLKNLRKAMDETVFKDGDFSEKSRSEVRRKIREKKKKSSFFMMKMPVIVTAFLFVFLLGGAYTIFNIQPHQMDTANYNRELGGSNNSENAANIPLNEEKTENEEENENKEYDNVDESSDEKNAIDQNDSAENEQEQDEKIDVAKIEPKLVTALRLTNENNGWTGGKGWIARSENKGASWDIQWKNQSETVKQIFALNNELAWAVLDDENTNDEPMKLLRTTDGGSNWTIVGEVPVSKDLFTDSSSAGFLHFNSDTEGFAGNFMTQDGGVSWVELPIPENTIHHPYFHDQNNGWAVTYEEENTIITVKRTEDGGANWKIIMERETKAPLRKVEIRSAGVDDAWIQMTGDAGMSQVGYSLFHTQDNGKDLRPVLVNSTAGAGPGPGFTIEEDGRDYPAIGSAPGDLFVLTKDVAFMSAICAPCDNPISIGGTTDGGETWAISEGEFIGYAKPTIGFSDEQNGWWIQGDGKGSSILYITKDGGQSWEQGYHFNELSIE